MELRSYEHLHFIQAIESNSVVKLLNVNRGRPGLRFKKVKEIYEARSTEHHESVTIIRPKNELESLQFDPDLVKFEIPCLHLADRKTARLDTSDFGCGYYDEGCTLDDFGFCDITLKEIKSSCKARKRKCAETVNLSQDTSDNLFPSKQDHTDSEAKEDELDLKEPLIRWKSKILKNKKSKRKCIRSRMSISSQSATIIVKTEKDPVDHNFLQLGGNLLEPTDIKLEVDELDYPNFQTEVHAAANSSRCDEHADSCGVVVDESHGRASDCGLKTDASTSFESEQASIDAEASREYLERAQPESVPDAGVSSWEIVNVDSPEILGYKYPDIPFLIFENEVSLETISMPENKDTDGYHNFQSLSTIYSLSWPNSSDGQLPSLDMVIDNRLINEGGAHLFEGGRKDALPYDTDARDVPVIGCIPSWGSDSCVDPNTYLVSSADYKPLAEQKQPCANSPRTCPAAMHPSDATEELTASAESEDYNHLEPHQPPERLLSKRKDISPTSREKLFKAMNSMMLNDEQHSECREVLIFGNQTDIKVIRAEEDNEMKRAEIANNTTQVLGKSICDKRGASPMVNVNGPRLSRTVTSLSTGCSSTQNISQSAVAFSMQQMRDIERLATKLTAELSSMKELVKEMVHSDVCPATSLKHNIAKVTVAIKNASKAEETSKKLLSIMAKDCNRFCKIMKLTEANAAGPAPVNVVHKERKKIVFADEVGGKLCHVKVFRNDTSSSQESIDIEA